MKDLQGTLLKGYELEERIGAGGYGVVYRARQTTLGREVAVKIILPGYANNPDFIRRFESEATLIARLEHPHITPLHDFWRDPDGAYLVMRYLRGGSISQALQSGPFELATTSQLLDQISSALDFAHRHDVIHRDIKPGNLLLDEDGNGYLADFGIAKDLAQMNERLTAADAGAGSLDYIAPEQARSEAVTPQTDIYSLGVTLFEMVAGEHPFKNDSPMVRLFNHINNPLPEISDLASGKQDAINEIIQKATAKDPAHRYPDALALAIDFREAVGRKATAQDASIVEQLTMREQEVLSMIARGMSNREIADELVVTLGTVKWHITQLYKKLGVRSRVQAIVRGRELNLIVSGDTVDVIPGDADSEISVSLPEPENPYKGLHAFQVTDARTFFGRDELTKKLIERLTDDDPLHRFLAIIGPSGSGKSSLVRAGLIYSLWKGAIPGSEKWFVVHMIPGTHPLDKLEAALVRVAANQASNLRDQLQRDERGLLRVADIILPADDSELVIVVDQFEETFTLVEDEEYRQRFLDLLRAAVSDVRSRVRVVVTLRADHYDRPLHYPEFGELVRKRMETVLPLSAKGLERAIRGPAEHAGVTFDQGLVEQIVSTMNYQAGALPLLQYALTELFDRREGRLLTNEAYQEIGGAVGALANRADEIYGTLGGEAQELAHQMFLRLVTLGEGAEDARRRATYAELLSLTEDDDLMEEVIDQFAAYRLLSLDHDPETRQPTVEVAHEAILREWERLRQWLNDSRDDIRQERAVARAANDWHEQDRDASYLLRGVRLEQVENWTALTGLALTPLEKEYVAQSQKQRDEEEQAEIARREREARLERRSRNFLRGLVAVLAIATLISATFGLLALQQRQDALDSAAEAQNVALVAGSQAALANNDTDTALALAWQAADLNPDSALAQAQLSEAAYAPGTAHIFAGNEEIVNRIAISPDDKTVFAGVVDGTVILWDMATGQILWQQQAHSLEVNDVAFTPDGRLIAATFDDRIIFWQAANGQFVRQIDTAALDQKIAISPSGEQFATIGKEEDGRLLIWDLASGEVIREFDRGSEIEDITYKADGSAILLASITGELTLIDAQTGQIIYEVQEDSETSTGALRFVALSPDGAQVVAAFSNGGLLVWDLATGDLLQHFRYEGSVFGLAHHPEDGTVLTGGQGVIRTVNPQTGEVLRANTSHGAAIFDLAITSDGNRAVTTALDGIVRLWDLKGGQVVNRFPAPNELLFEIALSPDARTVLVGSTDGSATLWDVETGEEIRRFVDDQPIMAVAFSPDGRKALIGAGYRLNEKVESGHIILWDVETGEEIRRFEGQPYVVFDVEFSPDGRLAASSGNGATAILWDVETGKEIRRFDDYWVDSMWPNESYWDVEFSPDGRQIFAPHSSGAIIGWDLESGEEIQQLAGHSGGAAGIVFSDDGQRLVSGGSDSQVILWDMQTGNILHRLKNHAGGVGEVRFSPDETLLLGGGGDGTGSLWRSETGEVIRRYGGGFVFSPDFFPDGRHAVVGHRDGAVELWRIDATLDELLTWTQNNRHIPELTCEQRLLYNIEPLCESEE